MAIDKKTFSRNLLSAFESQGVIFTVSALMSLIVPKILGVEQYGYWQLFILYGSYAALFHLGLNDGVYLINGGKSFSEMDSSSIKAQFCVSLVYEVLISVCLFFGAFIFGAGVDKEFVIGAFAVYVVIFNVGAYWGAVCQAANQTFVYSRMLMIDRCSFLIPLLAGILLRIKAYQYYVLAYIISRSIAAGYIAAKCRSFSDAKLPRVHEAIREAKTSIRVGIKLTISYQASVFILGAARFIAEAVWGIESFGQLSFALSLLNFFITFVNQVGMVLFPALRRVDDIEFRSLIRKITNFLDVLLPSIYLIYVPIVALARLWLPQYQSGFEWLSVLLPICVYNSRMEVLSSTSLKVMRRELSLMVINIGAAILSLVLAVFSGYIVKDMGSLIWSMLIPVVARSIISEIYVSIILGIDYRRSVMCGLALTVIYLIAHQIASTNVACGLFAICYAIILVIYRDCLGEISLSLKKALKMNRQ